MIKKLKSKPIDWSLCISVQTLNFREDLKELIIIGFQWNHSMNQFQFQTLKITQQLVGNKLLVTTPELISPW